MITEFFEYNTDGIRTQKMYADRAGEVKQLVF